MTRIKQPLMRREMKSLILVFFKDERDYLKRLILKTEADLLPKDGSEAMTGDLDMTSHSILNLKDPQPSDASYAASVNFVNKTVNDSNTIFTVKIATDLVCAQRRYHCYTSGFRRQCYSSPQGTHLPIYANLLWFSVAFAMFRRSGPLWNSVCPSHLPFGDACIFSSISVLRPSASREISLPIT